MPLLAEVSAGDVPQSAEQWLHRLTGPSLLRLTGRDSQSKGRGLSVLMHGNEPSGFRALHRYLREKRVPRRDTLCIIGGVEAAAKPPIFSHRLLPGRSDLNRCFLEPPDGPDGAIATAVLGAARQVELESMLDLHNNSGHNPAYGVLIGSEPHHLALVELFSNRCVLNTLRLGTLIEALDTVMTSVVVECGQSGTSEADEVAYRGLCRYLECDDLPEAPSGPMKVYQNSLRLTIAADAVLAFSETQNSESEVTLRPSLEKSNFKSIAAGSVLGWTTCESMPLRIHSADHEDLTEQYLGISAGEILAKRAFIPIMMTSNPEVAHSDCLCYLVEEVESS